MPTYLESTCQPAATLAMDIPVTSASPLDSMAFLNISCADR